MAKWFSLGFWESIARIVLKNRILMLSLIVVITVFMAIQSRGIHFTHTEANLLPEDHIDNINYNKFLEKFGEEGNLIIIGMKDSTFFTPKAYTAWVKLMNTIKENKEVDLVISINDLKILQKNVSEEKFELAPFIEQSKTTDSAY